VTASRPSLIPSLAVAIAAGTGTAVLLSSLAAAYLRPAVLPETCLAVDDQPPTPGHGMALIPGGQFKMGSEDFRSEEAPVQQASVDSFWMDTHDVTNAQFARFVAETGYVTLAERAPLLSRGGWVFVAAADIQNPEDIGQWWRFVHGASWRHPEGPGSDLAGRQNHPVVQVAFEDAQAYAKWAGRALPTEAQWERAARSGREGDVYAWAGDDDADAAPRANRWRGNFPLSHRGSKGFGRTSPVGCFPANAYGLYDIVGNVWQWTQSAWTADHDATSAPAPDSYTIKGGSFLCAPNFCMRYRPASRQPGDGATSAQHIGFRTVLNTGAPLDAPPAK